jgi:SAM-dependent methyltransferase
MFIVHERPAEKSRRPSFALTSPSFCTTRMREFTSPPGVNLSLVQPESYKPPVLTACMRFADESFELIVRRAAYSNFTGPLGALREMRRVLKHGRRAVIIDLRKDTAKEEVGAHVDKMNVVKLNSAFIKLSPRTILLRRANTREIVGRSVGEGEFGHSEIADARVGFEITPPKVELDGPNRVEQ